MSSLTGNTGGGGGLKIKLKLGGQQQQGSAGHGAAQGQPPLPRQAPSDAAAAVPAPSASNVTTGTASGSGLKMRLKFGKSVPGVSGAQGSGGSHGAAAAAADGAGPSHLQPSAAATSEYYAPSAAEYIQNGTAFAAQQQQQYPSPQEQQSQQQKMRLKARLSLQQQPSNEPRYTATGRVQRAASRGISRLIAEEGGVPQDHSLPAPPPGTESRYMAYYDDPDEAQPERRSTRSARQKTIDATEYVNPDEMDFEGPEWIQPEEPKEPKPEKPKHEPRPKKPKPEKKQDDSDEFVMLEDSSDEEFDLGMADNPKDEDFQLDSDDEAMEVKPRRPGGGRNSRSYAAADQRPQRTSRRAAAAGVAYTVAAAAAAGEGGQYIDPTVVGASYGAASPSPYNYSGPGEARNNGYNSACRADSAGGGPTASGGTAGRGSKGGGGRGSQRRGSSRAKSRDDDDDDDFEDWADSEAEEAMMEAEDEEEDSGRFVIGAGYKMDDYSELALKRDHYNRPLWVCSDGRIFLETYSPIYKQAYDFLIAIAEPVCRPEFIHEYVLTPQSLYAAVSVGLDRDTIWGVLDKLSKVRLTDDLKRFIRSSTKSYGKAKLVLKHNKFWVETSDLALLERLLANPTIAQAQERNTEGADRRGLVRRAALKEHAAAKLFKATMAAAVQEGQTAAKDADVLADLAAAANNAVAKAAVPNAAIPGASQQQPAAASAPPAAAVAAGGRFFDPFGDSESESDPEDFSGVVRRRPGQPVAAAAATGTGTPGPAAAAAAAADDQLQDDDDEDVVGVRPARSHAAAAGAADCSAAAADGPEHDGAAAGSRQQQQQQQQQNPMQLEDSDGDDGSPIVGGRRRLKRPAAAAAAGGSDSEEDIEAELQQQQQQQEAAAAEGPQKPQRRGRLAATAAIAAATEAAAGDQAGSSRGKRSGLVAAAAAGDRKQGVDQGFDGGDEGDAGYEVVEEEEDPAKEVWAFEVKPSEVENVKRVCLPSSSQGLDCPLLEEYDFAHDTLNPPLDISLKPGVQLRPYQEKSLSKMFGNGRARSGLIVLPCGAGKSLVGVAAAARVKKSCLCLCTSSVSVDQWAYQFTLWTNLEEWDIVKFVAGTQYNEQLATRNKANLCKPCICVTTFNMIAHSGKRSAYGTEIMELIKGQEWGLLLLDEVHVVPAKMFRKVFGEVKAHCKLGLTATLVREDELIGDLNFLIGPKMYEANWLDLTRAGHIANVQCVEVWCPMTREFYAEYLNREATNDSIK
eukprot:GHUV01007109.1.p1 GENE.GHUV01007109.1~~GHUV01007109.1.p1  ORF type:complete len:1248 (+),score=504.27 GHUV01007109.1:413-4156(+)